MYLPFRKDGFLIYNQEIRGCFFLSGRLWFECEGNYDLLGSWSKE